MGGWSIELIATSTHFKTITNKKTHLNLLNITITTVSVGKAGYTPNRQKIQTNGNSLFKEYFKCKQYFILNWDKFQSSLMGSFGYMYDD